MLVVLAVLAGYFTMGWNCFDSKRLEGDQSSIVLVCHTGAIMQLLYCVGVARRHFYLLSSHRSRQRGHSERCVLEHAALDACNLPLELCICITEVRLLAASTVQRAILASGLWRLE